MHKQSYLLDILNIQVVSFTKIKHIKIYCEKTKNIYENSSSACPPINIKIANQTKVGYFVHQAQENHSLSTN